MSQRHTLKMKNGKTLILGLPTPKPRNDKGRKVKIDSVGKLNYQEGGARTFQSAGHAEKFAKDRGFEIVTSFE